MKAYTIGTTPIHLILSALNGVAYSMELIGDDIATITAVVNQGIDSHLQAITEACFSLDGNKLTCSFSPQDMLIVLRRLHEMGTDQAWQLRSAILQSIGIEEV